MWQVGIDVGGTFTDFVAFEPGTRELRVWKTLSTPHDPSDGIVSGLARTDGIDEVAHLRFGTTIATNAILERNGANVAYVTTGASGMSRSSSAASAAAITTSRGSRPNRSSSATTASRSTNASHRGKAFTNRWMRRRRARSRVPSRPTTLSRRSRFCLLCSYVEPDHERRVRDIFLEACPDKPVSISYDLLPKWKEHERSSTTIADAFVKPLVSRNLANLEQRLTQDRGVARVAVIKSNGGEMTLDAARDAPIQLSLSGPTGGVVGAKHIARLVGIDHLVTLDMGGTSTDVSTVVDGRESFTTSFEIEFGVRSRSR